jgi:hypothetical protein
MTSACNTSAGNTGVKMSADEFALTEAEIKEMTGYSRPAFQIKCLKELGIPARRRPDNTVLVLRMHLREQAAILAAKDGPKLKMKRR